MKKLTEKQKANLDFEISFYEGVIKECPEHTDALILLGDLYTKRGLYEKGLEIDLMLSKLMVLDPVVHYNLACSYSLLEKQDLALKALKKSLELGYQDFQFMKEDPDLENVRRNTGFLKLVEEYKD